MRSEQKKVYKFVPPLNRPIHDDREFVKKIPVHPVDELLWTYLKERNWDVRQVSEDYLWHLPMKLKKDLWDIDDVRTWIENDEFVPTKHKNEKTIASLIEAMSNKSWFLKKYTPKSEEERWTWKPHTPPPLNPKKTRYSYDLETDYVDPLDEIEGPEGY